MERVVLKLVIEETMLKKIISAVLLFSFINYLLGCYSEEQIKKEEIVKDSDKIVEVIYPSGDAVKFDSKGGRLRVKKGKIIGNRIDGKPQEVSLFDSLIELRTKIYPLKIDECEGKKIIEVISFKDKQFVFNEDGGYLETDRNFVEGKNIKGEDMVLKSDGIAYVYIKKPEIITIDSLKKNNSLGIKQAVLNGRVYTFDDNMAKYKSEKYVIVGVTSENKLVEIDTEEILYVTVTRYDNAKSCLVGLGGIAVTAGVVYLIILATKESCPFIYSFDGEKFVFDAEPLGGATSRGLAREEYSRLENIKEVDGKYKLRIVNEVDETQYIDALSLFIVDHPLNTEAVVNNNGQIYLTKNARNPLYSIDEKGNKLDKFLIAEDNICWQTKVPSYFSNSENIRHKLTFAFKKTPGKDSMNLILNAGTTLWGSNMIKEMLLLYGDEVDDWYDKINNKGLEYTQMMNFLQREELFELKLYLKEKDGWNQKAVIQGGGPFITEKRIIPLDVSRTEGDTLFIQVNPPIGFWSFDYIAMDDIDCGPVVASEYNLSLSVDYRGDNIKEIICSKDERYYVMPQTGDYFDVEFEAPELKTETKRTIFVKTSGYYEIHLPKTDPPNSKLLYEIGLKPGKIVEYSIEKYHQWYSQNLSSN
jgi:hypothetical protein